MKKTLMAKILSGFLIVFFIIANGGMQPQFVKAAVAQSASANVNGIVWYYEVDAMGNTIM